MRLYRPRDSPRIGCLTNRPAHDNIIRTIQKCLPHIDRAFLIVGPVVVDRAYAGRDHDQTVAELRTQPRDFHAGRDHAVAADRERPPRARQHQRFGIAREAEIVAQAKKVVDFVSYPGESDGVGVPFYPVPDEAITMNGWIEGGQPGSVDQSGDRHILIADTTNNHLYELFDVWHNGTNWEAGSGAFFDMNTNNRRTEGWTSADAAGLAILPGLVRYDEVNGEGDIHHAFRVTVSATNGHVFPASHTAGSTAGALPVAVNTLCTS